MTIRYLLIVMLLAAQPAWSDVAPPQGPSGRLELWLLVNNWPSLEEIRPAGGGQFDPVGVGIGGAIYATAREYENSVLLVGIDGFIAANESDTEGIFEVLTARQLYIGAAVKWAFGEGRGFSLDTGIGYHLADMAEIGTAFSGYERKVWDAHRASGYIGATWDLPPISLGSPGRWMVGFKAQLTDFGRVYGPGPLGPSAGKLDGPVYSLQIGYGFR